MTEIWTIFIIALSSSGIGLDAKQLTKQSTVGGQNYFSKYDDCEGELKKLFGKLDYTGYNAQLFHLPDKQITLRVKRSSKTDNYFCIRLLSPNS